MNRKFYIKVFGILLLSILVVKFGSPRVFVSNTPLITSELARIPKDLMYRVKLTYTVLTYRKPVTTPEGTAKAFKELPFSDVASGVQAAQDKPNNTYYIKIDGRNLRLVKKQYVQDNGKVIEYLDVVK